MFLLFEETTKLKQAKKKKKNKRDQRLDMSRFNGFGLTAVIIASVAGVYSGTKFFEPIIIDQLRKDGNLRNDIEVPKYDEEGNPLHPISVLQLAQDMDPALPQTQNSSLPPPAQPEPTKSDILSTALKTKPR